MKILNDENLDLVRKIFTPYTKRVYLVGGCVRDAFLGIKSTDFDIEVYDISQAKFNQIMQNLGANGVGKSFFIYKFKNFDIGLARTESKTGSKHTDFSVSLTQDERVASKRRDFTVNSIMLNIFDGKITDCWGGIGDLKAKILRHIDDEKFIEDPLRVLRAVQFSSRFGFEIFIKTLKLMSDLSIENLSKDRISAELLKFFRGEFLSVATKYLYELNLLSRLFGVNKLDQNFINLLTKSRQFINDERLFLYLLCGYFKLNIKKVAADLNLPKSYMNSEPFFDDFVSDRDLVKIATLKPLKFWLGLYDENRIKRAKELGLYDETFKPNIDYQGLVKSCLKGDALKDKISQLTDVEISKFLANQSPN
ncbi:CCA tRNA nucleotidyltransferase [Campylobacter mucosalis]|uniref:CCA tRNA nucleotidyltransferase n=1 Tax=Campylobacter mucosalis TaxID=202 RepID=UPI00146FDB71|nr:CCA tRNA nucleotidyltransferase [Campylobacter mucosalis]